MPNDKVFKATRPTSYLQGSITEMCPSLSYRTNMLSLTSRLFHCICPCQNFLYYFHWWANFGPGDRKDIALIGYLDIAFLGHVVISVQILCSGFLFLILFWAYSTTHAWLELPLYRIKCLNHIRKKNIVLQTKHALRVEHPVHKWQVKFVERRN